MRNFLTLDTTKFCGFVEKQAAKFWGQAGDTTLRNHIVNSSNRGEELFFKLKGDKSLKNFIRYAILVWYAPEEEHFMLRLKLEEEAKNFSLEDQHLISQILSSKAEMLCFLIETKLWHERDFCGNILSWNDIKDLGFQVYQQITKIVIPQRKRGYHDKGSRVESHRWLPKSDWSLTELQNQIELERETYQETTALALGFIT